LQSETFIYWNTKGVFLAPILRIGKSLLKPIVLFPCSHAKWNKSDNHFLTFTVKIFFKVPALNVTIALPVLFVAVIVNLV